MRISFSRKRSFSQNFVCLGEPISLFLGKITRLIKKAEKPKNLNINVNVNVNKNVNKKESTKKYKKVGLSGNNENDNVNENVNVKENEKENLIFPPKCSIIKLNKRK